MSTEEDTAGEAQDLVELLPVAAWVTSRDGRIHAVNEAACALLGYTRAELVGEDARALARPDEPGSDRRTVRRKDGRWMILEQRTRKLGPDRVLATLQDVTTLVERERELQITFDLEGTGHARADLHGRLLRVNRAYAEMVGYSAEELVGRNFTDLSHPDDEVSDRAFLRAVARGEAPRRVIEKRMVRKDGRVIWLFVAANVLVGPDGRPDRIVATLHDITERRRIEEELRASAEIHRTLSEAVPDMIWMGDVTGMPEYVNARWSEYTGLALDQVDADRWRDLVHPDDLPRVRQAWLEASAARRPLETEVRYRRRDGAWRWLLTRAVPIVDETGAIVRWVGALTDIDDRRRVVEALRDADRRKDEFLAMLSHELRNPLAPIRTGLHVLDRAPPGGEVARRTLQVLERQVAHLARLVDDLLDVTRISRGKVQLHVAPTDIVEIVARTVEDHRETLANRGIALALSLPDEPIGLSADATRVAQIVGNLLNNAAKFTPSGGHVAVTVERHTDDATVSVKDDGIGIEPALLGSLFEPFIQAATAIDRSTGGLGLGLALVKGLTELHGGYVEARSEGRGRGAEFVVHLPIGEAAEPVPISHVAREPRAARRVLVVEDNRDGAESLRDALTFAGHDVHVAYDGLEGVRMAKELRPDAILCDIGLPGIDGYEVARQVRADPELRDVLLVALTGYGSPEDRRRALDAGFALHLTKPTPLERLEQILAGDLGD